MCGITFVDRFDGKPANKPVFKRYMNQRGRGHEGFGYVAVKDGTILEVGRAKTEEEIEKKLEKTKATEILFHHRYPTSTPNLIGATHPIFVSNKLLKYKYYVVHNGVLRNEDELKVEHEELGFEYLTTVEEISIVKTRVEETKKVVTKFNDSEALAIDLALFLEGKQDHLKSIGTIAFVAYQVTKKNKIKEIIYGHNSGNPLVMERSRVLSSLTSTGKGEDVEEDKIYRIDYKTKKATILDEPVGARYVQRIGYGTGIDYREEMGWKDHMTKGERRRVWKERQKDPEASLVINEPPEDLPRLPIIQVTDKEEEDLEEQSARAYAMEKLIDSQYGSYEEARDWQDSLEEEEAEILEQHKDCTNMMFSGEFSVTCNSDAVDEMEWRLQDIKDELVKVSAYIDALV